MASVATRLASCFLSRLSLLQGRCLLSVQQDRRRHKATSRRRLPSRAKTFQQRLDERSAKDTHLKHSVNIGFPLASPKEADNVRKKLRGKHLEFAARHRRLKLDLKTVQDRWVKEQGPRHIYNVIEHYGLYCDLFRSAFFYNSTPMSICFDYDEAFVTPVYYGNKIRPSEAAISPFVDYESDSNTLWTLVMTSPDGHLQSSDKECLHWLVTNIRGCDVHGGGTLCEYLQPFPVKGAGYFRYAFVLFQQQNRIDFTDCHRVSNSKSLSERTFSTADFYQQYQKAMTPASICFFQSRWDSSVTSVFHDLLKMKEPVYEFVPPPDYHLEQGHFPHWDSLEWYLNSYFDIEDTEEDWYTEALQQVDPPNFPANASSEFPYILSMGSSSQPGPSWMRLHLKSLRLPQHQWKDLTPGH